MHFIDECTIFVAGGHGGKGCIAFRREKYVPRGGPSGGDGGHGGSVVLIGDEGLLTLLDQRYQKRYAAEDGEHGMGSDMYGKAGPDWVVKIPLGTLVTDADTGKHVADVPIGAGPDGAAYDASRGLVFSPNGKVGTLTIIHEDDADHYRVVATVPTQKSARTMVLDEATHRVYLPAAEFDPLPANAPPHTRPPMKPDTFTVLEVGEAGAH